MSDRRRPTRTAERTYDDEEVRRIVSRASGIPWKDLLSSVIARTRRRGRSVPLGRSGVVLVAGALFAAALGGCGDPVGPESLRMGDLDVELTLSSDEVRVHESFDARVVLRNRGDESVTLVSGCSAFAFIALHRAAEKLNARGTRGGCFSIPTSWEIPPGGGLVGRWTVTAETFEGEPLGRGLYVFRVDFLVDLPDLEALVRIL